MRNVKRLAITLALWAATFTGVPAQEPSFLGEYRIKAACLYQFGNYVEWPERAFPEADSPFVIGVLGEDPFGAALETTVRGRSIDGRRIAIRRSRQIDDLRSCHILFISRPEQRRLPQILRGLGRSSVLTVGEAEPFLRRGGMIALITENKRVRFEINPRAAMRAGLKINARLLRLSDVPLGRRRR